MRATTTAQRPPPGVTARGEPMLASRFRVPAVPSDLVVRSRLVDRLRSGVQGPVTLVSAPAGYGKSVLLASWAALGEAPGPVAWLTLEDGDERPEVFWSYVVEALRHSGAELSVAARRSRAIDHAGLDRLAAAITRLDAPVVLVLDDGERLVDPGLGEDLSHLVRLCDGALRLVLLTRVDPALPLHRFRLDGTLTEIRAAELTFTDPEAVSLVQLSGLDLTAAEGAALRERTGGWPAGLKFATLSLVGSADPRAAIREFTGNDHDLASYLVGEVLDALPPESRDLLLRSSIVDELPPELFELLTGCPNGPRVLADMSRGNSFIEPVSGPHGPFRYQALFREFLRAQLAYEQPDLLTQLHRTAASWFARDGQLLRAVRHAVEGGAWAEAATFAVDAFAVGELVNDARQSSLAAYLEGLPDDEAGSDACLVRAAMDLAASDPLAGREQLARARRAAEDDPTLTGRLAFRVSLAVLEAVAAGLVEAVDEGLRAVLNAERLFRLLPPDALTVHPELAALVAVARGRLLLSRGDLGAARTALAAACRAAEAPGCDEQLLTALGLRALLEVVEGRTRPAAVHAERADAVAVRLDLPEGHRPAAAAAALAWVLADEDRDAATDLLRLAERSAGAHDELTCAVLARLRAEALRAQGDLSGARDELLSARSSAGGPVTSGWLEEWLQLAAADLSTGSAQAPAGRGLPVQRRFGDGADTTSTPEGPGSSHGLVVEPLTRKEQEVLGHLAALLTTEEIATTMFVSVNTVRTHVRSILRKMGASRRHEAVRRAWELDLLPAPPGDQVLSVGRFLAPVGSRG